MVVYDDGMPTKTQKQLAKEHNTKAKRVVKSQCLVIVDGLTIIVADSDDGFPRTEAVATTRQWNIIM